MYTSLEAAREEIWERWNDAELRRRVLDYVGEVPDVLCEGPKAVWYRSLATPNFECLRFANTAKTIGLQPLFIEIRDDKFCTMNPDKIAMGKMTFYHGKGKRNGVKTTIEKVLDFNQCDGKRFDNISTVWRDDFVSFHRQLLYSKISGFQKYDLSSWHKIHGGKPSIYYHLVMALFVCNGILFENFLDVGNEGVFVREIARPAIERVTKHFGLKPLIVRLLPEETEADPYWCWYPGHLEAEVMALLADGEAAARLRAAEGSTGELIQGCNPPWK